MYVIFVHHKYSTITFIYVLATRVSETMMCLLALATSSRKRDVSVWHPSVSVSPYVLSVFFF